ncbi:MAG: acyl-CoA/acyl-ACP dehydrogenase [Clostridia bacterium]|nr:acyl-CoA/acyl-ACP dehydrogenase [Deltaproteobacteria bacterium]
MVRADSKLVQTARRIGVDFAGPNATSVDVEGRFPREAIDAIKKERLLSAFVPKELGGLGCTMLDLAAICEALGEYCSASAMVFAMHQIQVACLVRHGMSSVWFKQYMRDLADKQSLIASVTSEVGVGGDMRSSVSSLTRDGDAIVLNKDATTISYGAHADDLLITTRATAEAPASDQILVLVRKDGYTLEQTSQWNTMGMRGTCSPGFKVRSKGTAAQVLDTPFATIASHTMVPFSHIVWSSLWTGIATAAVTRAQTFVRGEARKKPGSTPPTALRLVEAANALQSMRNNVHAVARECDDLMTRETEALSSIPFALKMNSLKIVTSQHVVDIVHRALLICGIAAYKNDTPFSMGRLLRDAHSAALMVGNDRILATNAQLALVIKDSL